MLKIDNFENVKNFEARKVQKYINFCKFSKNWKFFLIFKIERPFEM